MLSPSVPVFSLFIILRAQNIDQSKYFYSRLALHFLITHTLNSGVYRLFVAPLSIEKPLFVIQYTIPTNKQGAAHSLVFSFAVRMEETSITRILAQADSNAR